MRAQVVVLSLLSILFFLPAPSFGLSYHQAQVSAYVGSTLDPDVQGPAYSLNSVLQIKPAAERSSIKRYYMRLQAVYADEYASSSNVYGLQSLRSTLSVTFGPPESDSPNGFGIQADLGINRVRREYVFWIVSDNSVTAESRSDSKHFLHLFLGGNLSSSFSDRAPFRFEMALGSEMNVTCLQFRAFFDVPLTEHVVLSMYGLINKSLTNQNEAYTLELNSHLSRFHTVDSKNYAFVFAGLGYRL